MFANVRGFNWRREFRIGLVVVGALVLELVAIAIGLVQFFDAHKLVSQVHLGSAPTWSGLIFALTVTTIAFTSVESASGLAGEVKAGRGALRRLIASGTATVVLAYVGIAIVAVTALPLPNGSVPGHDFTDAPVIDIMRAAAPPLALAGARLLDRRGRRRHLDRRRRLGDARALSACLLAVDQPPDPQRAGPPAPAALDPLCPDPAAGVDRGRRW